MRAFIGQELLRKLPPAPTDVRDTKLTGFVLRVRESGKHSYYAAWGRGRWKLLGKADALDPHEAREQARKALGDVKGNDPIAAQKTERGRITFHAFVTKHYEPWAVAQRKHGQEQANRLRSTFGPTLNSLRLDEISAFHFERWRTARLKAGKAAATVNRDLNTLRGALSRAVEWNLLSTHPLARVKRSKSDDSGTVRFLTPAEETRLRASLEGRDAKRRAERERANTWRRERHYAEWPAYGDYTDHLTPIVLLALNTGMRRGELFAMKWTDVDFARLILTVRGKDAKSGQTRHIPLNSEAVRVLTAWKDHASADVVFAGRDGEPLDDIKTAWLKLAKAAALESFRFHDLRHTFASKLVMAGVDLNTVRELLGHADLKMTLRYAHLAPEHKAAAVAKLVGA